MKRLSILLFTFGLALPAQAQDITFSQPINCVLGETCYIQQYMDVSAPSQSTPVDHQCGAATYKGHDGTDFALLTFADLNRNVPVVAAAPGTVLRLRNTMNDDGRFGKDEDCGNGVIVQHDNGYETQYCHLKKGSITVSPGDRIARGHPLGAVGYSGNTTFPHVHFQVFKDGVILNPFQYQGGSCSKPDQSLWIDTPAYAPGGLVYIGATDHVPSYEEVTAGTVPNTLQATSPAFVVYALLHNTQPGDVLRFTVTTDAGPFAEWTQTIEKAQAMAYRAVGEKRSQSLPAGAYTLLVRYERGSVLLDQETKSLLIQAR